MFQPHTFSRTKALFDDFATQLKRLDRAVILPVFSAAREKDTGEVSSEMLAEAAGCETADSMEAAAALLKDYLREGDVLLTIGAGDAYMVGDILLGENL